MDPWTSITVDIIHCSRSWTLPCWIPVSISIMSKANVSSWRHHKEVSSWYHLCSNIQHSLWSQLSWWLCKVSDCGHRGRRTAAGSCGVAPSAARRSWWRGRGWRPRLGERESWPLHSSSGIILLHPHTDIRPTSCNEQCRNIGWCQVCH